MLDYLKETFFMDAFQSLYFNGFSAPPHLTHINCTYIFASLIHVSQIACKRQQMEGDTERQ